MYYMYIILHFNLNYNYSSRKSVLHSNYESFWNHLANEHARLISIWVLDGYKDPFYIFSLHTYLYRNISSISIIGTLGLTSCKRK